MRVSVCVAATRADSIGAAVRSIADQTYTNWELIVVVQGPSSAEIVRSVERELDPRRRRVICQSTRGLSRARNAAIAASSGEVIAFTDDDCEAGSPLARGSRRAVPIVAAGWYRRRGCVKPAKEAWRVRELPDLCTGRTLLRTHGHGR